MRKIILIAAGLIALCSTVIAATLTPPSLLNPAGSTAGQVIMSSGPSTAPAWGTVSLSGIGGTLPIANGGTGATSAGAARSSLGLGTAATANTGTSGATVPLLNVANTWSGIQSFTATINPSQTAGIAGTTTNNNANAGVVGEYIESVGTATALTSGAGANATSISLTAGDWETSGNCSFVPAGTTSLTVASASISTASLTSPGDPLVAQLSWPSGTVGGRQTLVLPPRRLSLAATTTVYAVTVANFSVSTATVQCILRARRAR